MLAVGRAGPIDVSQWPTVHTALTRDMRVTAGSATETRLETRVVKFLSSIFCLIA